HRRHENIEEVDSVMKYKVRPSYAFGFNGMERDDEVKGTGNSYDFGARIQDPRLGKWLSLDPLASKYPGMSPYNFGANNPIFFIDHDGRDIYATGKDIDKVRAAISKISQGELKVSYEQASNGYYRIIVEPVDGNTILGDEAKVITKLASKQAYDHSITIDKNGVNNTARTELHKGPQNSNVTWTARDDDGGEDVEGMTKRPGFVGLFHELLHSEELNDGSTDDSPSDLYPTPMEQKALTEKGNAVKPLSNSEVKVRTKENRLRKKIEDNGGDVKQRVVGSPSKIDE
ncbi:MAG: RHS repeat-associated core domain-containing protein, partial [Salibacteraceae bacterium]